MPKPVVNGASRLNPGALFEQLGTNMYRRAYENGMNLSTLLEQEDPSEEYGQGEILDAYGRVMKVAGIKTNTDSTRFVWADRWEAFEESPQHRALVPEWAARVWRRTTTGMPQSHQRALIGSDDFPLNGWIRPYADAANIRAKLLQPAVPVDRLVALTTPIDGDAYRSFYLTEPTGNEYRMARVGQAAEIPRAKLTGSEHTIRLYKYGRALEISYEQIRRQRIDWVAFHIARLAVQSETDKVAAIIDILLNGDGNSATAATNYNNTTLDTAAAAGTLTLKAWLAYKLKFWPYNLGVILVQEAVGLQLQLLNMGSANIPLVTLQGPAGFGSLTPINPMLSDAVAFGITADAPALKIVGIDPRTTVERVVEIGANINEVDRWITRQVQVVTMTEVEGYGILDANGNKTLNVNA